MPWKLVTDAGEIDLWPFIDEFFTSLNGKRTTRMKMDERCGYALAADKNSEFHFKYIPDEYVLLEKQKGFGGSNVHACLDEALVWLSGRMVEIEIENGKQIKFAADKSEKVYGVYFIEGNACEVPEDAVKTVCKAGQHDRCIFLSAGSSGFLCQKFSGPTARMLLDRLAKRDPLRSRIGNCTILGRKERQKATTV